MNNQDHAEAGAATAEEKAAKNRVYHDALAAGLKAGSVCAYLISPDGKPVAVAPLNEDVATDPDRLAALLERVIRDLKADKGDPLVKPKSPAVPSAEADALVLHVVARYLERQGDECVPYDAKKVLGTKKAGNWADLPSEDWVVLSEPQWTSLLPPGDVRADTSWEPDKDVVAKVLTHFYPPTENTDLAKNRIDKQSLQARVESIEKGVVRARLEGQLRMKHPFYHKDDDNFVETGLVGYLEFDAGKQGVRLLHLVTDDARYGGDLNGSQPFGAAVRLAAPAK